MKAIILAAGRGTRMGQLTEERPKCLTEVGGKTLLQWQLSALKKSGIGEIVIVGGYKKELLKLHGCDLLENPRWSQTNMFATLSCAREYLLKDECVVSYADILYHPSAVGALLDIHEDMVITYDTLWKDLWRERFEDPLKDAETFKIDSNGIIKEIGKKTSSVDEIEGQYMGLLKFRPRGWRNVEIIAGKLSQPEIDKLDMTSLLQVLIENGASIFTASVHGKWCEVDNEYDLSLYEKKIEYLSNEQADWKHDWR